MIKVPRGVNVGHRKANYKKKDLAVRQTKEIEGGRILEGKKGESEP